MNWEEFKEELKQDGPLSREIVERAEKDARQVSGLIDRREELGLSDRDITKLCRARNVSVEAGRLKKTVKALREAEKIARDPKARSYSVDEAFAKLAGK